MAKIPGLDHEVYFGDTEQPLPGWEVDLDDADEPDPVDTPPDVVAVLGLDTASLWPDEDSDGTAHESLVICVGEGLDAPNAGETVSLHGLLVKIETPRGSVRRGIGPDGDQWETVMTADYGEIVGVRRRSSANP